MYTNQLVMGALVHTIKTKFINEFSPRGERLLFKETVINGRRGEGRGGAAVTGNEEEKRAVSVIVQLRFQERKKQTSTWVFKDYMKEFGQKHNKKGSFVGALSVSFQCTVIFQKWHKLLKKKFQNFSFPFFLLPSRSICA